MTSLTIPKDDAEVQIALGALQWGASHSQPSTSKSTKQTALGTVAFPWQRERERTCLESISAEIRWSWVSWNFPKVAVVLLVFPWNQLQSCDCCVDCEFIVETSCWIFFLVLIGEIFFFSWWHRFTILHHLHSWFFSFRWRCQAQTRGSHQGRHLPTHPFYRDHDMVLNNLSWWFSHSNLVLVAFSVDVSELASWSC